MVPALRSADHWTLSINCNGIYASDPNWIRCIVPAPCDLIALNALKSSLPVLLIGVLPDISNIGPSNNLTLSKKLFQRVVWISCRVESWSLRPDAIDVPGITPIAASCISDINLGFFTLPT